MFTIVDRGSRIRVSGSDRPGGCVDHHDKGYEQGPCGSDPKVEKAPLSLPDTGRGPWPNGRGGSRVKLTANLG